jgi:hypothetical protein
MHRQTLVRMEKVLGHEHPSTLGSMSNLAIVLDRQGKYEEAEARRRQTLAQREKVLGSKHPDTRRQYVDALASQEQSELTNFVPSTMADGSARARIGKGSKLMRGLAKIGIISSKSSARQ